MMSKSLFDKHRMILVKFNLVDIRWTFIGLVVLVIVKIRQHQDVASHTVYGSS
jgi:hypothetical protein